MKRKFYTLFADDSKRELPKLNQWHVVLAENYEEAALKSVTARKMPWKGDLFCHVHGLSDPKYPNGMPMVCHTLTLRLGA